MEKKIAKLKIIIDMDINLPEGDTEISEKEKKAICDRIYGYLRDIGTTSDDYEGCLAGQFIEGDYLPELVVEEAITPKVIVNVGGGMVQGARANTEVEFKVYDEDNMSADGDDQSDIDNEWNDEIPKEYPLGIY